MRSLLQRWPLVVVSAVVWVLFWGDVSVFNLVAGALLGALIAVVFPMPPVPWSGRIRPVGLVVLVATLLADLVRGSLTVAARALGRTRPMRNAIVRVELRTRSDLYLTMVAQIMSVVPGSSVVEVRRQEGACYLHVMDVGGPDDLARLREQVLAAETRVVRAFGSVAELEQVAGVGASR